MNTFSRICLIGVAMTMQSCTTLTKGSDGEREITGTWAVEDVDGADVIDRGQLKVTFEPEMRVSGFSGCNRFSGTYARAGEKITLRQLVSTRMACVPSLMQQEDRMLKTLKMATKLSWIADGTAILSGPEPHIIRLRTETHPYRDGSGYGPGHSSVTPIPDNYRCGADSFKIAFEEGMAFVTLNDGTMVRLPRDRASGGSDPEAPRIFSNGRMWFSQEIEGGRAVRFARGRMAPVLCERHST